MEKTEINSAISPGTVINPNLSAGNSDATQINYNVQGAGAEIPKGTMLDGKYMIYTPLNVNSGEANLYVCADKVQIYVAKLYRRQSAVKSDITAALTGLDSPYVAKLYDTGTWNGMPYEILPYFQQGSLERKTFSFHELKTNIIPALNEGLRALHEADIIHKDLKPSNIMLNDDGKTVAIIDFGISSIREDGNTVVVTKTGMTPEYSAPETFRNLFLEESDYYSLGVTIYELFCGHTPYSGMDKETIEQFVSVQKIPFAKEFPKELRDLITGLTYSDITNRKEKENPNRRWTYDEVKRWCRGEHIPIPGIGNEKQEEVSENVFPKPYTFMYQKFKTLPALTDALSIDWVNGKKRLYRSLLSGFFRDFDPETASYCMDAEEAAQRDNTRVDFEYFCLLYRMNPKMEGFHWLDDHYDSMQQLGEQILTALRNSDQRFKEKVDTYICNGLFSARSQIVEKFYPLKAKELTALEAKYRIAKQHGKQSTQDEQMYLLGYLYAGTTELILSGFSCTTFEELTAHIRGLAEKSSDMLDRFAGKLIVYKKATKRAGEICQLDPQFAAWLSAVGKAQEVKTWRKQYTLVEE